MNKIPPTKAFLGLLLIAAVVVAYLPALHAGFIWDDDDHLTRNPCIVGPLGLREIWTSSRAVYYPLVLTSFWIVHRLVALDPLPYHLLNILMHGGCAVAFLQVLRRLNVRGAWVGAAVWALHPVMVQSVAWITELKNTQSALFYLLSILFFLKSDDVESDTAKRRFHTGLSVALFAMAITSKPSTVMLPVVLALCLWWRRDQFQPQTLIRLAPFFLISILASIWTIWEQRFHSGAFGAEWVQPWPQRLAIAGRCIWFYLGKLAWPDPLIFIYPRWNIDAGRITAFLPGITAIGALFYLWWKRNGPLRPIFFAAAYFVALLFPILGFFNVYFFRYSFVSDHFQYLASLGPLALCGSAIATVYHSLPKARAWLGPALAGGLSLTLGIVTFRQAGTYLDSETLWRATITGNPNCWMAQGNLGGILLQKGEVNEAIAHFRKAVEIWPEHAEARNNLANALLQKGSVDEAAVQFQKVLDQWPNESEVHNNLGGILLQQGQIDKATAHFQKVLERDPNHAKTHNNLGNALLQKGDVDQAIAHYERALELSFDPAAAHYNLGNAFLRKGMLDEAIAHYQKAVELRPGHANAQNNLGNALRQKGETAGAISHFQKAVEIDPQSVLALNNLAWVLATCSNASLRDGVRALELAEKARVLSGDNPMVLRTLAAALSESGQFSTARDTARRALELADAEGNAALAESLRHEIALYQLDFPYHEL